jgi:hypothetical protein
VYGIVPLNEIVEGNTECNKADTPIVIWELDEIANNILPITTEKFKVGDVVLLNKSFRNPDDGDDGGRTPDYYQGTVVEIPSFNENFIDPINDLFPGLIYYNEEYIKSFTTDFLQTNNLRINNNTLRNYNTNERKYFIQLAPSSDFPIIDRELDINTQLLILVEEKALIKSFKFKNNDLVNVTLNNITKPGRVFQMLDNFELLDETFDLDGDTYTIDFYDIDKYSYSWGWLPDSDVSIIEYPENERHYCVEVNIDGVNKFVKVNENNMILQGEVVIGGKNRNITKNKGLRHHTMRHNIGRNINAKVTRNNFKHRNITQKNKK